VIVAAGLSWWWMASGCATSAAPASAAGTPGAAALPMTGSPQPHGRAVFLEDLSKAMPAVAAAWAQYADKRVALASAETRRAGGGASAGFDGYQAGLEARLVLADGWARQRAAGTAPDPYLDQLVDVQQAGFLKEYVIGYISQAGCTIPAAALAAVRFPKFRQWSDQHLRDHRPLSLANITAGPASADPRRYPAGHLRRGSGTRLSGPRVAGATGSSAARLGSGGRTFDRSPDRFS
jgi:hypothetical protein